MRRLIAFALTAALALALVPGTAEAHSFGAQGPTHTHATGSGACPTTGSCNRWILANGAIIQGNTTLMQQQYGYVLVFCSWRVPTGPTTADDPYNEGWAYNKNPFGPYGHVGELHTYCRNPQYTVPGSGTPFLAGWAVNA